MWWLVAAVAVIIGLSVLGLPAFMAYEYTAGAVATSDTAWQAWLLIAVLIGVAAGLVVALRFARRNRVPVIAQTGLFVALTWAVGSVFGALGGLVFGRNNVMVLLPLATGAAVVVVLRRGYIELNRDVVEDDPPVEFGEDANGPEATNETFTSDFTSDYEPSDTGTSSDSEGARDYYQRAQEHQGFFSQSSSEREQQTRQDQESRSRPDVDESGRTAGERLQDAYVVIGVPHDASDDALKRAYRKLAMATHPDSESGSNDAFRRVQEAYEVIEEDRF